MKALTLLASTLLVLASPLLQADSPAPSPSYIPKQSDRPLPVEGDEPGFRAIFDGRTLEGWRGHPTYWRVENGAIVGEITPATVVKSNTFIIWQGDEPADFELKLDYRITEKGNSGVNYRSVVVPDPVTPANAFAMRGYQLDLDGAKKHVGNNYEEKGRLFLALRGQVTRVVPGRPPVLVAQIGEPAELTRVITPGWNSLHIIARGTTVFHLINGRLMSVVMDDDATRRPARGQIGMQVHVGPPMKVEYRNIRLKTP